jgi:hypothetical protein
VPRRRSQKTTSPWWDRGQATDYIYDSIRESKIRVVNPGEMASAGMRQRGLDPDNDKVVSEDFELRIRNRVVELRRDGTFEKMNGRGADSRWWLTRKGRELLAPPYNRG